MTVDTPDADSVALRSALRNLDLVIAPARPCDPDLSATRRIMLDLRGIERHAVILLDCVKVDDSSRIRRYRDANRELGEVLPVVIPDRVVFQDAFASGKSAAEYDPRHRACRQIADLFNRIKDKLEEACFDA